ncbi:MAG: hypothetical protein ACKO2V_08415, partial [Snowella sp.]
MSILINTVVAEAESKEKYLDIDILNRLRQDASEFQQRLNILNLITENYKLIINEAINSYPRTVHPEARFAWAKA